MPQTLTKIPVLPISMRTRNRCWNPSLELLLHERGAADCRLRITSAGNGKSSPEGGVELGYQALYDVIGKSLGQRTRMNGDSGKSSRRMGEWRGKIHFRMVTVMERSPRHGRPRELGWKPKRTMIYAVGTAKRPDYSGLRNGWKRTWTI